MGIRAGFAAAVLAVGVLPVLWACSPAEDLFGGTPRNVSLDGRRKPGHGLTDSLAALGPPDTSHVYLTAVQFAYGYDWQSDSVPSQRGAKVALLVDGREAVSMGVSDIDSDSHRAAGGHLFVDVATPAGTTVYRDGLPLVKLGVGEKVMGFHLIGDDVHTLSQRRGGAGVYYRINGALLFQDPAGTAVGEPEDPLNPGGAFRIAGDDVWFCYRIPVKGQSGDEFRFVRNGSIAATLPAGTVRELFDFAVRDSVLYRLEMRSRDAGSLSLVRDGRVHGLGFPPYVTVHKARLVPWGDGFAVTGYKRISGLDYYINFAVSEDGEDIAVLPFREMISQPLPCGDGFSYLILDGVCGVNSSVSPGGAFNFPSWYSLMGPRCTVVHRGRSYAALSPAVSPALSTALSTALSQALSTALSQAPSTALVGTDWGDGNGRAGAAGGIGRAGGTGGIGRAGGTGNARAPRLYVDSLATDFNFNGYFTSIVVE